MLALVKSYDDEVLNVILCNNHREVMAALHQLNNEYDEYDTSKMSQNEINEFSMVLYHNKNNVVYDVIETTPLTNKV